MSLPAPLQLPTGLAQHRYADAAALAEALARDVAAQLRAAIAARGQATLRVSGGRSPIAFFTALRQQPLNWSQLTIGLVDERWVPQSDEASNARLVREHLLQGSAAAAHFVALSSDDASAEAGLPAVLAAQKALATPCDVMVLGMGDDGHTASLFPNAPGTAAAMDLQSTAPLAIVHPTTVPHARITLTLPALLQTRQLILSIQGADKRRVIERAALGNAQELPIAAIVQNTQTPLSVYYSD